MPRSIDEGFRDFLTSLTPSTVESEAAKGHRASIEQCLKSKLGLRRFFRTGSFGNGTSISGYSDVDYFASLPAASVHGVSTTTLVNLRDVLTARFSQTSGIRVNCPAVQLPFGNRAQDNTEVVPASYQRSNAANQYVYKIPDCKGGWMISSPEAHNSYVRSVDNRLGKKVKPLIRFIKAWKYYQDVPISSFYLELRVAKYAAGQSSILYSIDVKNVFEMLASCDLAPMQDPMGVSGLINPCITSAMLVEAKSRLSTALSRAKQAWQCEANGDIHDAFGWWDRLYASKFPSYYR